MLLNFHPLYTSGQMQNDKVHVAHFFCVKRKIELFSRLDFNINSLSLIDVDVFDIIV